MIHMICIINLKIYRSPVLGNMSFVSLKGTFDKAAQKIMAKYLETYGECAPRIVIFTNSASEVQTIASKLQEVCEIYQDYFAFRRQANDH